MPRCDLSVTYLCPMGGQVLSGGVIVFVAVALWLVYLLPSWQSRHRFTSAERNALDVLELSWPLTQAAVKYRYKELVKIHHPDANGGARAAEEKLKEINAAYSTLRASENLPVA